MFEKGRLSLKTKLNNSENRSLKLHQQISLKLSQASLEEWSPRIEKNIKRLKEQVKGEPHLGNLERWEELVTGKDLEGLRLVLTGLDRSSVEMREVSPMSGIISDDERLESLSS